MFDLPSYLMGSGSSGSGGGGSSTLVGLTDVDISNPTDGQTLVYNATSGKWENGGGGGGGAIMFVRYDINTVLDATWAEIKDALSRQLVVLIKDDNAQNEIYVEYCQGVEVYNGEYFVYFEDDNTYSTNSADGYPSIVGGRGGI